MQLLTLHLFHFLNSNSIDACIYILMDMLYSSSILARYAAYEKFSILVKVLPKFVLYRNMALE